MTPRLRSITRNSMVQRRIELVVFHRTYRKTQDSRETKIYLDLSIRSARLTSIHRHTSRDFLACQSFTRGPKTDFLQLATVPSPGGAVTRFRGDAGGYLSLGQELSVLFDGPFLNNCFRLGKPQLFSVGVRYFGSMSR